MKTERNGKKLVRSCKVCQKTIVGSTYKYNAHLFQHRVIPSRYRCTFCPREFFRKDEFQRHVNNHTGSAQKKEFVCDNCGRIFISKFNLMCHLKIHDDSYEELSYKCVACGVKYCEERLLKYHIRKTHYNLHETETAHIKKEVNETWIEPVKASPICVEMTKINTNVLSIRKSAVTTRESKKEVAGSDEITKFKQYLTSVFAQNNKSQYSKAKCDYCHKEMLKKSLLSHIRERHLKLKRFHCDECNRSFARHYQMVDHTCGQSRRRKRDGKVKAD